MVDDIGSTAPADDSSLEPSTPEFSTSNPPTLEMFALGMLKNDPFVTIAEIRRDYALRSDGRRPGWWRVFFILKRNRLLRRRSRFRYAWGRT